METKFFKCIKYLGTTTLFVILLSGCVNTNRYSSSSLDHQLAHPNSELWKSNLDVRALGEWDTSNLAFYGFAQVNVDQHDHITAQVRPDINIRAWQRWRRNGLTHKEYNQAYIDDLKQHSVLFVGGSTASVLFEDEPHFESRASRNTIGEISYHNLGEHRYSRGNMTNHTYRNYLIEIGKIQIDLGVDGLFFDEANANFEQFRQDLSQGFDIDNLTEFQKYLCATLNDTSLSKNLYLKDLGQKGILKCHLDDFPAMNDIDQSDLINEIVKRKSLLSQLWGKTIINRPDPTSPSFVEQQSFINWQDIVTQLREYARRKYEKEILITSNGIFPLVDFQSVGLYSYNKDDGGNEVNYVPNRGRRLDGKPSLLGAFKGLVKRSRILAGNAPVVFFLDWPDPYMNRFYNFSADERRDYIKIFASEAYAAGAFFAMPIRTSMPEDPTAEDLNMVEFFKEFGQFFREHRQYYSDAKPIDDAVEVSNNGIAASFTLLDSGVRVLHLINHNYRNKILPQKEIKISLPFEIFENIKYVKAISHDFEGHQLYPTKIIEKKLEITVDSIESYIAIIFEK